MNTYPTRGAQGRRSPELVLMLHRADQWARRTGRPTLADTERVARDVARQGRAGDTEIAHVARGEIVVPRALQNPEVMAVLRRAAAACNIPFASLSVGNKRNRINPKTGAAEFNASQNGWWGFGEDPYDPPSDVSGQAFLGQPARAAFNGKFIGTRTDSKKINYVDWRDNYGNLHSYLHTGVANGLKPNDPITAGQVIGFSDGSGADKPHLHWEVRPGTPDMPATANIQPVDPETYLGYFQRGYKPGSKR